jgi:hypothetical protein
VASDLLKCAEISENFLQCNDVDEKLVYGYDPETKQSSMPLQKQVSYLLNIVPCDFLHALNLQEKPSKARN